MTQSRRFAIVGPSNWNKLPQSLRDLLPISSGQFRKHLKTSLFVSEDTDPGRERLWFKGRYINVRLQLQLVVSYPHKTQNDRRIIRWRKRPLRTAVKLHHNKNNCKFKFNRLSSYNCSHLTLPNCGLTSAILHVTGNDVVSDDTPVRTKNVCFVFAACYCRCCWVRLTWPTLRIILATHVADVTCYCVASWPASDKQ